MHTHTHTDICTCVLIDTQNTPICTPTCTQACKHHHLRTGAHTNVHHLHHNMHVHSHRNICTTSYRYHPNIPYTHTHTHTHSPSYSHTPSMIVPEGPDTDTGDSCARNPHLSPLHGGGTTSLCPVNKHSQNTERERETHTHRYTHTDTHTQIHTGLEAGRVQSQHCRERRDFLSVCACASFFSTPTPFQPVFCPLR